MLLSIIAAAFHNLEGIVKAHAPLAHLTRANDISFEWIVADGDSSDSTSVFPERLSGEHRSQFISGPDNGTHDAIDKGIAMTRGRFALFLSSGDILYAGTAHFIRQSKTQSDQAMAIGDVLLSFGDDNKTKRRAKPGWYTYHSLPASHQTIFFPFSGLNVQHYDLQYRISPDYTLAVQLYKPSYAFKKLSGLVSGLPIGGASTTSNLELCRDAKKVQRQILRMSGFWTGLSEYLRLRTAGRIETLYGKT